jgi:hypothetical protein
LFHVFLALVGAKSNQRYATSCFYKK